MSQQLIEYVGESNLYAMDFSGLLSLVNPGELLATVVSAVSDPEAGLTITEQAVEQPGKKRVTLRIVPSATGSYEIQVEVTTNQTNTKVGKGTLIVRNL